MLIACVDRISNLSAFVPTIVCENDGSMVIFTRAGVTPDVGEIVTPVTEHVADPVTQT